MNPLVRRRLTAGALLSSAALVAGLLLAPSSTAATNGLSINPSGVVNTEKAAQLTFNGTDADFEYGGSATFSRVGGGQPLQVTLDDPTVTGNPPKGKDTKGTATVDFTDGGAGLGVDGPVDAGVYNVSATGDTSPVPNPVNPGGGTDTCSSCFTVLSAGPVGLSSITPSSLRPGNTGTNISILGANFERGATIQFLFADGTVDPLITANAAPTSDNTNSGTVVTQGITTSKELKRRAKIDAGDSPGARGIRVTNLDGNSASCSACFFVSGPPLTGLSPTSGVNTPGAAPVTITFSGPNVVDGEARLEFTGNPGSSTRDGLSLVGVKAGPSNGTSITATFDLQNAAPGPYQGVIRDSSSGIVNACEQPACPAFTVIQSNRAPTVTGLDRDPNTPGNQQDQQAGSTQVFNVSGTNFSKGVAIKTTSTKTTVTAVEFVSPTLVRATFVAAKDAVPGDYDVTATLTDGSVSAACAKCYTITANTPSPSPSSTVSPSPTAKGCPSGASPSPTSSASATPGASASATPSASASATPSASASASAPASPRPSGSPSGTTGCPVLEISVNPKDIVPNEASTVSVKGAPNQPVELYAYSRPNTTYSKVRSGTTNSSGDISWNVTPGGNTRLYAHYASGGTTTAGNDSPSVVITVHTSLSLSAYRDGVRKYHFQGTNLPRRAGQLITLYRYATGPNNDQYCVPTPESDTTAKNDGACRAIITSQAKTGPNNTWRIDRTFVGDGRFYFVVRTGDNINNGRGHSNQRLTVIH